MNKISRRNFIRASALSALGAAAAGALSGCSNNAASSSAASSVASSAAASEQPAAAAASSITWDDIFATSYSQANRRSNPDAKAPETPEEYIEQKGNGDIMGSMMVGMVDSLNIPEEQFMNNKPAWLGDEPQLADKVEYTKDCEVLVIGAGQAGTAAALRCAEEGLNTICCEVQTWEEYDNYACDLTTYNSKFFLDKGAEKYDPMDIFTEYMVKALGHANQKIVKDYATRSGEALDWMLAELDPDYVAKYAHAVNYKGNKHFQNPCSHSYYYVGMTQWRDTGTDTNTNNNMWPYTVRLLQQKAVEKGCEYIYGAQGLTLVHENGKVTGAIFTDIDGKYFQVNADAVIVAAGDFGGNPDMRLDLCDTLRNLAWSYGKDRTDVNNVSSMGRDGSGIRMMLWAGATMEAGPRAGQAADINSRPSFPFGGIWPIFGNDGKRFFNETITRHGSVGYLDMMPEGQKMPYITHGFLRADRRDSMGFVLLYGKKTVSRWGFRHSVLEVTRRPVCHVLLQRCAGADMLDDAEAQAQLDEAAQLLTEAGFVQYLPRRWAKPGCEDKFWQGAANSMDVLAFGLSAYTRLDGMITTNTSDLNTYLAHSADYEQITVSTVPVQTAE